MLGESSATPEIAAVGSRTSRNHPRCKPVVERLRAAPCEEALPPLRALGVRSSFLPRQPQESEAAIVEEQSRDPRRPAPKPASRGEVSARAAAVAPRLAAAAAVVFLSINRPPAERSKGSERVPRWACTCSTAPEGEPARRGPGSQVQPGGDASSLLDNRELERVCRRLEPRPGRARVDLFPRRAARRARLRCPPAPMSRCRSAPASMRRSARSRSSASSARRRSGARARCAPAPRAQARCKFPASCQRSPSGAFVKH